MKCRILLSAVLFGVIVAFPLVGFASTVKSGGQLSISPNDTLVGSVYLAGFSVGVQSTTTDDLTIAGYAVSSEAPVAGDLTVISGGGFIKSPVAGDLRIVGGSVVVDSTVGGDLVVVGGDVRITSNSKILGDLILVAGSTVFDGEVLGVSKITGGQITINGTLNNGGDITAIRDVNFGSNTKLSVPISYFSPEEAVVSGGSESIERLLRHNRIPPISETGVVKRSILQFLAFWHLLSFVSNLLLGLALAYASREFIANTARDFRQKPIVGLLVGSVFFVVVPVVATLAVVSLFALPVGLLVLLSVLIAGILASPIASICIGRAILSLKGEPTRKVNFQEVAIGAVVFALIGLVPQFGFWIKVILSVIAVGAFLRVLIARLRGPSPLSQALFAIRGEDKGFISNKQ